MELLEDFVDVPELQHEIGDSGKTMRADLLVPSTPTHCAPSQRKFPLHQLVPLIFLLAQTRPEHVQSPRTLVTSEVEKMSGSSGFATHYLQAVWVLCCRTSAIVCVFQEKLSLSLNSHLGSEPAKKVCIRRTSKCVRSEARRSAHVRSTLLLLMVPQQIFL